MKITLIREERESGKEAVSTQETDMLMEKLKTENKTGYITELRSIIPHLKGTNARYEHIDRLPRLYPAVEMTRTKAGGASAKQIWVRAFTRNAKKRLSVSLQTPKKNTLCAIPT